MAGPQGINSIGAWLKNEFGEKVVKLSIDAGFTCPNRDGAAGYGGCIFCSPEGSGELASSLSSGGASFDEAIRSQISMRREKWPDVRKFIAYFQSYTNTYAPVEVLRQKYEAALAHEDIVGIAIATRPDCLPDDVLDLLSELNEKTFLWVELGLQTIHGDAINRCYPLAVYDEAVSKLTKRNIRVVTHLILGLPGPGGVRETKEQMEESARYITRPLSCFTGREEDSGKYLFGLKLHLMNVVKGSAMETMYPGYTPFVSIEEYVSLVCDLLTVIPPDVTVHRLTGDVPRRILVSPEWSYKKRTILNGIAHEIRKRGIYQGSALSPRE